MPLGDGVIFVSVADPGGDLGDDCLLVGDSAIETLRGEDAEFGFGQVDYVGLEQARRRTLRVLAISPCWSWVSLNPDGPPARM